MPTFNFLVMKRNHWLLLMTIFAVICISCKETPQEHYAKLLQEWIGKEIKIPNEAIFTIQGQDTAIFPIGNKYKILIYADSTGCISCKLQLERWKMFMEQEAMDSIRFLFFFSPEKRHDIINTLKTNAFTYPVCIDEQNELNKLNQIPTELGGQTFLLDKNNKILAMGNPIHNPKVKDLYLKIIQGKDTDMEPAKPMTTVSINQNSADMGTFDWQQEQTATFTLTNTGDKLLVIEMIDTSCGCITVDYKQEPVRPGDSVTLHVTYKAEQPEYFSKTVTVYCNAKGAPIRLTVSGNAK